MTDEEFGKIWLEIVPNKYMYSEGEYAGKSVTPKSYIVSNRQMYIKMSDGKDIPYRIFDELMAVVGVNPNYHNNTGGESAGKDPIQELKEKEERWRREQELKKNQDNNSKPKEKININSSPIVNILQNGNSEKKQFPIHFEMDLIKKEVYQLIELSFKGKMNYFSDIVDFYVDQIDKNKLQEIIRESVESFLIEEFGYSPENNVIKKEDDVIEGKVI